MRTIRRPVAPAGARGRGWRPRRRRGPAGASRGGGCVDEHVGAVGRPELAGSASTRGRRRCRSPSMPARSAGAENGGWRRGASPFAADALLEAWMHRMIATLTAIVAVNVRTDEAIARVASRQGGVDRPPAARCALGLDRRRDPSTGSRPGGCAPIYRGVYAVGHDAIPSAGGSFAALLVAGPGGALSHRTAAALQKLIPSMPPFVEITTTRQPAHATARASSSTRPRRLDAHDQARPPGHHPHPHPPATSPPPARSTRSARRCNQALVLPPRRPRRARGPRRAPASKSSRTSPRIAAPTRSGLERASSRRC